MRALILAGGRATRLYPLSATTPKALTPLLGRPFLEHVLAWLARHAIRDVTLLLGHLAEPIAAHFGDGSAFGVRLAYLVEGQPLGSGGAIKQLEATLTEPFLVLNGDIFTDLDLGALVRAHQAAGAELTISLTAVDDPSAYGVVALDGDGWAERFVEKPPREQAPSNLINAGAWLFEPSALGRIVAGRFSMVEQELFPEMAGAHRLYGYRSDAYWIDAGTPARYLQLHHDLLNGRAAAALPLGERAGWPGLVVGEAHATDGPPPWLHATATLQGPVTLGAGNRIGAGARVAGPAALGANAVLQDGASVSDSVLWEGCRLGPGAAVSGSVLASGCVVGQGGQVRDSVLGDGAQVRSGVVVIGRTIEPGLVVAD